MVSSTWLALVSIVLSDLISLAFVSTPAIVYALIMRFAKRIAFKEIAKNLGLTLGVRRYYTYAFAILSLVVFLGFLSRSLGVSISPSLERFSRQPLTFLGSIQALSFGLVVTGFGEELLFRGLIGGILARRMNFWKANIIQAAIFVLPHLPLALERPEFWPLVVAGSFSMGLVFGWLRFKSGSIFPCWIVHGFGNVFSAILAMMR